MNTTAAKAFLRMYNEGELFGAYQAKNHGVSDYDLECMVRDGLIRRSSGERYIVTRKGYKYVW